MATQGESSAAKGTLKKLGISGVVAAVGAGVGLLLTLKPKRVRESVSELPGSARNLVEDLTQRAGLTHGRGAEGSDESATQTPRREIPAHFEARRRERRQRREKRRQHATT